MQNALLVYVNDVLALEREIMESVALQVDFDAVLHNQEASAFLKELFSTATRHVSVVELSQALGSGTGVIQEVVSAALGVLAGIYENVRKHAFSLILRHNYTALSPARLTSRSIHWHSIAKRAHCHYCAASFDASSPRLL